SPTKTPSPTARAKAIASRANAPAPSSAPPNAAGALQTDCESFFRMQTLSRAMPWFDPTKRRWDVRRLQTPRCAVPAGFRWPTSVLAHSRVAPSSFGTAFDALNAALKLLATTSQTRRYGAARYPQCLGNFAEIHAFELECNEHRPYRQRHRT